MTKTVHLTHDYPYATDMVWDVATDLDYLQIAVDGLLKFKHLPSGKIIQGQTLNVEVSLFGKLPYQPYQMTVINFDEENHMFQSSEIGAGVRSWRHTLHVVETETGSQIKEKIEIDAGRLTWAVAAWARFMYRRRHQPRLTILAELTTP